MSKLKIYQILLSVLFLIFSPLTSVIYGYFCVFFVAYAGETKGYIVSPLILVIPLFAFGVLVNKEKLRVNALVAKEKDGSTQPAMVDGAIELKWLSNLELAKSYEDFKSKNARFKKQFYSAVALIFFIVGFCGYFGEVSPKKVKLAEQELVQLKAKDCKLDDHTRVYSKYRLRPLWVSATNRYDAVEYVTDTISKSRVRNKRIKAVEYQCANGETMRSVYRYKDLMVAKPLTKKVGQS